MAEREQVQQKPPVRVTKTGVNYVKPADILTSVVGRGEINKTAESGLYRSLAQKGVRRERTAAVGG